MEMDDTSVLLARIKSIYEDHRMAKPDGFLTSVQITKDLNKDPTAWWFRTTPQKLALLLKPFRLFPDQHRIGRGGRAGGGRGYWFRDLQEKAFRHI